MIYLILTSLSFVIAGIICIKNSDQIFNEEEERNNV